MPSNHHTLSSPSPLAFYLSQHQGLFKWVGSLHQVAKVLETSAFSISPSNEYSGLISFRKDWLDLPAVQGTLKSLLQHNSSKTSIIQCSAFLIVQLWHPYMTTGKTTALTRGTFAGKVMSLLFNMLSRLVIAFLPRSKHLLISCLQTPSAVILEPPKIKSLTVSTVSPYICHEVMGPDAMILVFWLLSFKPAFSLFSFTFIKRLFSSSLLSAISVVSFAYLRLLVFLLAILIPVCASSSPAFLMMYSAYKLNTYKLKIIFIIMTLFLSFKVVCYTNILQNIILDKSFHSCIETPWMISCQKEVFTLCLQIHFLKDPAKIYNHFLLLFSCSLESFVFFISRYFPNLLLHPHLTIFPFILYSGSLIHKILLHPGVFSQREAHLQVWGRGFRSE